MICLLIPFAHIKSEVKRKQNMHQFFIMPRKFGQRTTMEMISSICHKRNSKQLVFSNTHNDAEFLASNVESMNEQDKNSNSSWRIRSKR